MLFHVPQKSNIFPDTRKPMLICCIMTCTRLKVKKN